MAEAATIDRAVSLSAPATEFLTTLLAQVRAQDGFGHWTGKSDAELLAPYILTAESRRALPILADPDPDQLWRLDMFYAAVGVSIERRTGIVAQPMMKMHHEGFGRVLLTAGRLVVINRYLRDVHRFGFASTAKLAEQGAKLVDEAVAMIEAHPTIARL